MWETAPVSMVFGWRKPFTGDLNFDRLGLLPLRPGHFGHIDQISYPVEPVEPITIPIEVMLRLEAGQ